MVLLFFFFSLPRFTHSRNLQPKVGQILSLPLLLTSSLSPGGKKACLAAALASLAVLGFQLLLTLALFWMRFDAICHLAL